MKKFIIRVLYYVIIFLIYSCITYNMELDDKSLIIGGLFAFAFTFYDVIAYIINDAKMNDQIFEICVHGIARELVLQIIKDNIDNNDLSDEEKLKEIEKIINQNKIKIEIEEENE